MTDTVMSTGSSRRRPNFGAVAIILDLDAHQLFRDFASPELLAAAEH